MTAGYISPVSTVITSIIKKAGLSSLSMVSHSFPLAAGPHPHREPTLMPRLGSPCPRPGMAAGAEPALLRQNSIQLLAVHIVPATRLRSVTHPQSLTSYL